MTSPRPRQITTLSHNKANKIRFNFSFDMSDFGEGNILEFEQCSNYLEELIFASPQEGADTEKNREDRIFLKHIL